MTECYSVAVEVAERWNVSRALLRVMHGICGLADLQAQCYHQKDPCTLQRGLQPSLLPGLSGLPVRMCPSRSTLAWPVENNDFHHNAS